MSQNENTELKFKKKGGASKVRVTVLGRFIVYFPFLHLSVIIFAFYASYLSVHWMMPVFILAAIYLFPMLAHRLHDLFFPLTDERVIIPNGQYPAWWGSYQIQYIFISIPALEAPLRLIPGLYSAWLRAWGSQIGRRVVWPPMLEITDRSLMVIGDGSVIGHHTGFYCHVLNPTKDGRLLLYVKKIVIGKYCFIGSGSRIGPGNTIPDMTKLDVLTDLRISPSPKL